MPVSRQVYTAFKPRFIPTPPPPLSSPSTLAAMITMDHTDWWLNLHCSACCCDLQVLENCSAQLQQQLAQKGTELSSAEESLASLQQEMSQAQDFKHQATKVKLFVCLHRDKQNLHMATFLYRCSSLSSIKMYAVPKRVQFLSFQH